MIRPFKNLPDRDLKKFIKDIFDETIVDWDILRRFAMQEIPSHVLRHSMLSSMVMEEAAIRFLELKE